MSSRPRHVDVYIGLGANLGDRRDSIGRALDALDALPETELTAASDLYETPARFVEDQPDFINACARIRTGLEPRTLLEALLAVERAMGRVRQADDLDKGPRVIDLDILFYGERIVDQKGLTIPHPDLHNRRFVLEPLAEIAGDFVHPEIEKTVRELLAALDEPAEGG